MALPTFLIIGAGKAGTTSLHHYLGLHPEVQMSAIKETNYFSGPAGDTPYKLGRVATLDAYEALFDPAFAVRGESSPSYATHPFRQGVPERIAALVPEAKLIYSVRDPIARTVSHYEHRVASGGERRPLRQALGDLSDPEALRETCLSLYATQLERYLESFPAERILVVDQADLLASRADTLREIFAFLAVDPAFETPDFEQKILVSGERRAYPAAYNHAMQRVVAPAARRVPAPVRRRLRSGVERRVFRPLPRAQLDADQRQRLAEIYAPEVARLRELTGRSFPTWSV
jgi:hypothetical protein